MIEEPTIPHFHRQAIIDELKLFEWESLLDVGCGVGTDIFYIHREFPNAKLYGIDQNGSVLSEARQYGFAEFQDAGAERLPFSDKSIDVVLIDGVLWYVSEPTMALQEAKRVAKKAIILCNQGQENYIETVLGKPDRILKIGELGDWGEPWNSSGKISVKYL